MSFDHAWSFNDIINKDGDDYITDCVSQSVVNIITTMMTMMTVIIKLRTTMTMTTRVTMMTKPPVCECETIPTCLTVHCFTRHHMLKFTILNKMTVMMHGVIVASHCFKY